MPESPSGGLFSEPGERPAPVPGPKLFKLLFASRCRQCGACKTPSHPGGMSLALTSVISDVSE
eukprot:10204155-Heterocapsa_arctica.AAC.1